MIESAFDEKVDLGFGASAAKGNELIRHIAMMSHRLAAPINFMIFVQCFKEYLRECVRECICGSFLFYSGHPPVHGLLSMYTESTFYHKKTFVCSLIQFKQR